MRRTTRPETARWYVGAVAAAIAAAPAAAGAQTVVDGSYTAPDGSHVLRQSIEVPAGVAAVWEAFTTSAGVRSWAVPVAEVDFRLGGIWESSYRPDARIGDPANIRNRYIAFLPHRMLAIQAVQAPPGFPHPELLPELFTVIELEPLGADRTRVTISGVGYRAGEGYAVLRAHFERGNAWSLEQLSKRFTDGSVEWPPTPGGLRP
jgi:uncharacterized protein YndB with AHSA1/START domain